MVEIQQQNLTENELVELSKAFMENQEAEDATWILTSAFIIFTMQSGFGLLEAGLCLSKTIICLVAN